MPSPDMGGARLAWRLDLACSAMALMAGAGVWVGAWLARGNSGLSGDAIVGVAEISCMATLCAALAGIWLIKVAAGWPRLAVSIIIGAIGRTLSLPAQPRAVHLSPWQSSAHGIAGLIEALARHVRRHCAPRSPSWARSEFYAADVREGRLHAQQIVRALFQDAEGLGHASDSMEQAGIRLTEDARVACSACGDVEDAVSRVTDRVVALTTAVAETTSAVQRISATAVAVSEQAFAGQRCMVGLDERTAEVLAQTEHIAHSLRRIGSLRRSASQQAAPDGGAGCDFAPLAAGVQEAASASLAAIAALQVDVARISSQALQASRLVQAICEQVMAHDVCGLALSDAVARQGEEIADILQTLNEARRGFVTLKASVEAVSRHGADSLAAAETLREAASQLPGKADAIAAILREIPDFIPPSAFGL